MEATVALFIIACVGIGVWCYKLFRRIEAGESTKYDAHAMLIMICLVFGLGMFIAMIAEGLH